MNTAHYEDIGQYLRESRESLQIPLLQAARDLFIREKYLKAIESGHLEVLPGKAYIRGYIKTYAQYLRLDESAVLERYAELLGERPAPFFAPEPSQRQNIPGSRLLLLSAIGILLIYALWYFTMSGQPSLPVRVAQVPAPLLHLLDKTPTAAMDSPAAQCLNGGDLGCFALLYAQPTVASLPTKDEIRRYDIPFTQPLARASAPQP